MHLAKRTIAVLAGFAAFLVVWVYFGAYLQAQISNVALIGALKGISAIVAGLFVHMAMEKLLGLEEAPHE